MTGRGWLKIPRKCLTAIAGKNIMQYMSDLNQILADIEQDISKSDRQRKWQPSQLGSIDIRIAADGNWYHEERPFRRQALVKLFASVLHREGENFYLRPPAEKLKIRVDDAPFVASLVEIIIENKHQAIVFTTNLGDRVVLDENHPLRIVIDQQSQAPRPYVHCRDGLDALISRSAFFDLINLASEQKRHGKTYLTINSMGYEFDLGCTDPLETT